MFNFYYTAEIMPWVYQVCNLVTFVTTRHSSNTFGSALAAPKVSYFVFHTQYANVQNAAAHITHIAISTMIFCP